jgi:hypothetical protein
MRGVRAVEFDGKPLEGDLPLLNSAGRHEVRVVLGR